MSLELSASSSCKCAMDLSLPSMVVHLCLALSCGVYSAESAVGTVCVRDILTNLAAVKTYV